MSERTFTQEEIGVLLQRAAQLQGDARRDSHSGLTVRELQEAAQEAGIDPRYVEAAVREADSGLHLAGQSGHTRTKVFAERTVKGASASAVFEVAVTRLREELSTDGMDQYGLGPQYGPGVFEMLGETHTWRHMTGMGVSTVATVRPAGEDQHLRIERKVGTGSTRTESIVFGIIAALVVGAAAAGVSLATGLIGAFSAAIAVFVLASFAAAAGAIPAIAALDTVWRDKKLDQISTLADEICLQAVHPSAEGVGEASAVPAAPSSQVAVDPKKRGQLDDSLEGWPSPALDPLKPGGTRHRESS